MDQKRDVTRDTVARLQSEIADLRRSRTRLALSADADRRSIEGALHDGIQQHLVALAVDLQNLRRLVEGDPAAARTLVDEMAVNVRVALEETRDLSQRIYPPLLDGQGLGSAIRSAAAAAGVSVLVEGPPRARYSLETTSAVYWSWVEALSFTPRGSEATVRVHDTDRVVTFEIVVAAHGPDGGIDRLRDRIEALDGGVDVDDSQDGLSRIHGWLPLSR